MPRGGGGGGGGGGGRGGRGRSSRTLGGSSDCDSKYQETLMNVARLRGFRNVRDYLNDEIVRQPFRCRQLTRHIEECVIKYGSKSNFCNFGRQYLLECEAAKKERKENFRKAALAANFVTINAFLEQLL